MLLQKTVSTGAVQIENDGLMDRYLYTDAHEAIISDEMFMAVQQEKFSRSKGSQNQIDMRLTFWYWIGRDFLYSFFQKVQDTSAHYMFYQ